MTSDLSDDELLARLIQHGESEPQARWLVDRRDRYDAAARIEQVLGR